jgi:hypothetical protein
MLRPEKMKCQALITQDSGEARRKRRSTSSVTVTCSAALVANPHCGLKPNCCGLKHQKEKRSMDYFAGLDVSVKETSVCIVDDAGIVCCAEPLQEQAAEQA